jgi:hypothetical protein
LRHGGSSPERRVTRQRRRKAHVKSGAGFRARRRGWSGA